MATVTAMDVRINRKKKKLVENSFIKK